MTKAFTLRYFSKRAYIYVRQTLKYPLPGLSTLQRWASNINLNKGILKDVLHNMKVIGNTKTDVQIVTVLVYDKIKAAATYEYDQKEDDIVGPHNYMQLIKARGLFDQWKQPVFIGFDTNITKELLDSIIVELEAINYSVVACGSDCGGAKVGVWKALNIDINKTSYPHPVTAHNIYFFADVPHVLTVIRNWLLDKGFCLPDGQAITAALDTTFRRQEFRSFILS